MPPTVTSSSGTGTDRASLHRSTELRSTRFSAATRPRCPSPSSGCSGSRASPSPGRPSPGRPSRSHPADRLRVSHRAELVFLRRLYLPWAVVLPSPSSAVATTRRWAGTSAAWGSDRTRCKRRATPNILAQVQAAANGTCTGTPLSTGDDSPVNNGQLNNVINWLSGNDPNAFPAKYAASPELR